MRAEKEELTYRLDKMDAITKENAENLAKIQFLSRTIFKINRIVLKKDDSLIN